MFLLSQRRISITIEYKEYFMLAISIEDIKQLSVAERILLVEEIWDSIATMTEELPVTETQKRDLDLRLKAYKKLPDDGSKWPEVKKRIISKK
jgi:putative addiction module component (TIGR02574 family)